MIDLTPLLARLTPEERETLRDWQAHVPPADAPMIDAWCVLCFTDMPLPYALGALFQYLDRDSQLVVPVREVMKSYSGRLDLIDRGTSEMAALQEHHRRHIPAA